MDERYKKAFSEVYFLIENMHPSIKKKINKNFIEFLKENKDNQYIPDFNKISLLYPENLMKETRIILAILYDKNLQTDYANNT